MYTACRIFYAAPIAAAALLAACTTTTTTPREAGSRFRDCPDCPEMVVVPAGEFEMGFDGGEPERYEGPVRQMRIERSFAAGLTEVTVAQFRDFVEATGYEAAQGCYWWDGQNAEMRDNGSWRDPGYGRPPRDDEPVACVDWTDSKAYVDWLAKKTGKPYRLLSEAEFEYAADAGSTATWPWGNDPDAACTWANVFDLDAAERLPESPVVPVNCRDGQPDVALVGQFPVNAFGLHDMVGNVWEWTEDCYVMPAPDGPLDGSPVVTEECDRRSVKGGSWVTGIQRQRPTFRGRDPVDRVSSSFGLRVARDLD
jgi:formylglycine-generating enzyme required for sulfatase activity